MFTDEQIEFINDNTSKTIIVNACAGAGKTTAVIEKVKKLGAYRILYLVYNRSMKDEAEKAMRNFNHVTVSTFHGLAYKHIGRLFKDKRTESYTPYNIIQDLELEENSDDYRYAYNFLNLWNKFLLSGEYTAKSFVDKEYIDFGHKDRVLEDMQKLFDKMVDLESDTRITDDFYAFLYHLNEPKLNEYDILIIDEAQDLNMPMAILAQRFEGKLIIIGDMNQNIYSWRNTVSMFNLVKGRNIDFTYSFRVSQPIADICNKIYKDVFNIDLNMKGMNPKNQIVSSFDTDKRHVFISRKRMALFDKAYNYAERHKFIAFEGDLKSYGFDILVDAWFFMIGREPKNPFLRNFADWKDFKHYVEESGDEESALIINLLKVKGGKVVDMYNAIKEATVTKKSNRWDILFTTIHRSKGATYSDPLLIADDVLNMNEVIETLSLLHDNEFHKNVYLAEIKELINVLYVAITRGASLIVLPQHLINWFKNIDDFIL